MRRRPGLPGGLLLQRPRPLGWRRGRPRLCPRDRDLSHGARLFAVVPPGFEGLARRELQARGFERVSETAGGCFFEGSALRANRVLTLPTRVLQRVARFPARTFEQLVEGARAVDWSPFGGLKPQASCRKSRLYHSQAVEERLASVVPAGPGALHCRLSRDLCDLSVDTSGERLHRRGWRIDNGPAPLRETLAAGVLAFAEWRPGEALYDPMCGSGTLLIEAACAAAGLAAGRLRTFACEAWTPPEPVPQWPAVPTFIAGSDQSPAATQATQRNAARAGISVPLAVAPLREIRAPAPHGLLVCNPPYGRRAKRGRAFEELGAALRGAFAGWRAAIVSPEPDLANRFARPLVRKVAVKNGGLLVWVSVLAASAEAEAADAGLR